MDAPGLLLAALLCAEAAAVGLAWRLDRDSLGSSNASGVRPKAPGPSFPVKGARGRYLLWLLTFALADELAQLCLHAALDGAPRPLAGWARAAWHVSIALSLGWPAALAWAAWTTKDERPGLLRAVEVCGIRPGSPAQAPGLAFNSLLDHPRARESLRRCASGFLATIHARVNGSSRTHPLDPILGAYLGLLAGLAVVYPPSTAGLRWTLLAWELACVAVAWWGLWRRRSVPWGAAEVCLVVLVACESAVVVVGPFASDPFLRWWIARCFYLGAWGACCGVLARGIKSISRG